MLTNVNKSMVNQLENRKFNKFHSSCLSLSLNLNLNLYLFKSQVALQLKSCGQMCSTNLRNISGIVGQWWSLWRGIRKWTNVSGHNGTQPDCLTARVAVRQPSAKVWLHVTSHTLAPSQTVWQSGGVSKIDNCAGIQQHAQVIRYSGQVTAR